LVEVVGHHDLLALVDLALLEAGGHVADELFALLEGVLAAEDGVQAALVDDGVERVLLGGRHVLGGNVHALLNQVLAALLGLAHGLDALEREVQVHDLLEAGQLDHLLREFRVPAPDVEHLVLGVALLVDDVVDVFLGLQPLE